MRPVRRADNLTTFMCRLSWNLGNSISWNPLGLCFTLLQVISTDNVQKELNEAESSSNRRQSVSYSWKISHFFTNIFFNVGNSPSLVLKTNHELSLQTSILIFQDPFNITLPFTSRFSKWYPHFSFCNKNYDLETKAENIHVYSGFIHSYWN